MTTSTKLPRVITAGPQIREAVRQLRAGGGRVGLVPTMGALHNGHLSLAAASRRDCDATVATIFVNPTQFGPSEDFQMYPRSLDADLEKLAGEGVDYVFAPGGDEIYRPGHSTFVEPPDVAAPLEGEIRPGHFRGVATIVLKLFNLIPADVAYFGQKDYQQSLVIRRMVADLDVPMEIRVCPTIRESDGLAMSSRNSYLNPDQRVQAVALSRALKTARQLHAGGVKDASPIIAAMRKILTDAGIDRIDYITLANPETLEPITALNQPAIALVAARVGPTRLIDNMRI